MLQISKKFSNILEKTVSGPLQQSHVVQGSTVYVFSLISLFLLDCSTQHSCSRIMCYLATFPFMVPAHALFIFFKLFFLPEMPLFPSVIGPTHCSRHAETFCLHDPFLAGPLRTTIFNCKLVTLIPEFPEQCDCTSCTFFAKCF